VIDREPSGAQLGAAQRSHRRFAWSRPILPRRCLHQEHGACIVAHTVPKLVESWAKSAEQEAHACDFGSCNTAGLPVSTPPAGVSPSRQFAPNAARTKYPRHSTALEQPSCSRHHLPIDQIERASSSKRRSQHSPSFLGGQNETTSRYQRLDKTEVSFA
jgi:hypothetical protein